MCSWARPLPSLTFPNSAFSSSMLSTLDNGKKEERVLKTQQVDTLRTRNKERPNFVGVAASHFYLSLSFTHTYTLTHAIFITYKHKHTHTIPFKHTLSLSLSLSLFLLHTNTRNLSLLHTHTHIHAHTLILSLSLFARLIFSSVLEVKKVEGDGKSSKAIRLCLFRTIFRNVSLFRRFSSAQEQKQNFSPDSSVNQEVREKLFIILFCLMLSERNVFFPKDEFVLFSCFKLQIKTYFLMYIF